MAFRVKDLMIDVAGVAQPQYFCNLGTTQGICTLYRTPCWCSLIYTWCRYFTCPHGSIYTPQAQAECQPSTVGCGVSGDPITPVAITIVERTPQVTPEEVAPLKEQLRAALELVEKREAAISEQLEPKTIEDVTLLEGKLTAALEEIKAKKAELLKKK